MFKISGGNMYFMVKMKLWSTYFLSFLISHKTELCFKPESKYKSNKRELKMCFANRLFFVYRCVYC